MNRHDDYEFDLARRPLSQMRKTAFCLVGLGTLVCVSATIQVRMPLLVPVTAVVFGGWGLLAGLRARVRYTAARERLREDDRAEAHLLRIGDAERDQVTAALHDHFSAGRLTQAELEERLAAALEAKTGAEMVPLLADLPEGRRPR